MQRPNPIARYFYALALVPLFLTKCSFHSDIVESPNEVPLVSVGEMNDAWGKKAYDVKGNFDPDSISFYYKELIHRKINIYRENATGLKKVVPNETLMLATEYHTNLMARLDTIENVWHIWHHRPDGCDSLSSPLKRLKAAMRNNGTEKGLYNYRGEIVHGAGVNLYMILSFSTYYYKMAKVNYDTSKFNNINYVYAVYATETSFRGWVKSKPHFKIIRLSSNKEIHLGCNVNFTKSKKMYCSCLFSEKNK